MCKDTSWNTDAACGAGFYVGDHYTCLGATCHIDECCTEVFWRQSNVNPCRKAYTGNEIVCVDSYRSACTHSHTSGSGYTCDWSICADGGHTERMFCPEFAPYMCADKDCGGGSDWCCETDINQCRDGLREDCPGAPSIAPTNQPSSAPTKQPTTEPTTCPTANPTVNPTSPPTVNPTVSPTPPICHYPSHRLMFKEGFTALSICPTDPNSGAHKCDLCFKAESLKEKTEKGFSLDGTTTGSVGYSHDTERRRIADTIAEAKLQGPNGL